MTWKRLASLLITGAIAALIIGPFTNSPAYADSVRSQEWYLSYLNISKAQQISQGAGITLGVLDTGVDITNPNLTGSVLSGFDVNSNHDDGTTDPNGHGTGIASLIAGHGTGQNGFLGIAPAAKILPVASSIAGIATLTKVAGFAWAAQHGVRVINASFSTSDSPELKADVEAAIAAGVVVIAGAGNTVLGKAVTYPASYPGVVAVTGVNQDGSHDPGTVTGDGVTLSAPSSNFYLPSHYHGYKHLEGSSIASAIVAGVAALIRAKYPKMSAAEVVHRLEATATDKGAPGRDPTFGYGIVNPVAALTADITPLPTSATPPPPASTTPAQATGSRNHTAAFTAGVIGGVVILVVAAGGTFAVLLRRRNRPVRW